MRWPFRLPALLLILALAGCAVSAPPPSGPQPGQPGQPRTVTPSGEQVSRFRSVVARVEPVAERICQRQNPGGNCDFKIVVDDRPGQPANAFQTLDRSGRPILAFTTALIADVRNPDELAFVMSHEAAHHIAGHIPRQRQNAMTGAILLGGLASLSGASSGAIDAAVDLGASVGARSYSKDFELEADAIGTIIAKESGFDPVRGAEFFTQIPDPGDRFLGTHPPNAQRMEIVRRVAASL
ncbi:MAG: M48 family metallopeptidase [Roseovarius sp.]